MGDFTITLKNCAFFARHGVLDQEATLGQRFFVDVILEVRSDEALESDDVAHTVHYGEAYEIVERIMTQTRRNLIETLASDVARALCHWSPLIVKAEVAIRKPSAPIAGILDYAEVRVTHVR